MKSPIDFFRRTILFISLVIFGAIDCKMCNGRSGENEQQWTLESYYGGTINLGQFVPLWLHLN